MSNQWENYVDIINMKNNLNDLLLEELIEYADWIVNKYLLYISPHQLRRFFDVIKSIKISVDNDKTQNAELKGEDRARLLMLKPQMLNASTRQNNKLKELTKICSVMIGKTTLKKDFYQFVNFFESLIAFHKAYAKKN